MRTRPPLATLLVVSLVVSAAATAPPDAGKVTWAEGYPKAVNAKPGEAKGAVEVFGTVEAKPGWTVKEVRYDYSPAAGGVLAKPTELKIRDSKWGALDKDEKTMIPAKVPMDKGKWQIRVTVLFEGTDADGQPMALPYQTTWKVIEIK